MSDSSYTYEANETGNKVSLVGSTLIASSTPSRLPTAANSQLQLWNLAFKYLDIQSYATVQSVCPAWHSTCVFYNVGIHVLENRVNQGIKEATKLIRNSKNLKADKLYPCDANLSENVQETAQESLRFLQLVKSRSSALASHSFFLCLLEYHVRQLEETRDYFDRTVEQTEEADLVEIRLKRSVQQMTKLFPLDASKRKEEVMQDPSRLITDRDARQAWRKAVPNKRRAFISVENFATALHWPAEEVPLLNLVLDFPQEGFLTPFKWHSFVALFGPWKNLKRNFKKFAAMGGFCGYMGRAQAERLLTPLPPKTVLLRASRTHSSVMALTYRSNHQSAFIHLTNNSNFWTMPNFGTILKIIADEKGVVSTSKNVPLDYFVAMFETSGYTITDLSLTILNPAYFQEHTIHSPRPDATTGLPSRMDWHTRSFGVAPSAPDFDESVNAYLSESLPALPHRPVTTSATEKRPFIPTGPIRVKGFSETAAPPVTASSAIFAYSDDEGPPPRTLSSDSFKSNLTDSSSSISSETSSNLLSRSLTNLTDLDPSFSLSELMIPLSTARPVPSSSNATTPNQPSPQLTRDTVTTSEVEITELKKQLLDPNSRNLCVAYRILLTRPPFLDCCQLEKYLSDREFNQIFKMSKTEFERLPFPQRRTLKQQANLQ